MKHLITLNPQSSSEKEIKEYTNREASRAIVTDENNNVALLYVSKVNYYKHPGGGIDDGEDEIEALKRECLEEIGCQIDVVGEVGMIIEHRKMSQINQISYCYFAKVKGGKGSPQFTKEEIENGFKVLWVSYQEALKLVENNRAKNLEGSSYIVPRDAVLLKEASKFLLS